jgi:hypothetical protein
VISFAYSTTIVNQVLPIEPELFRGYNLNKKVFNQEVELIHNLEPIEVAEAEEIISAS